MGKFDACVSFCVAVIPHASSTTFQLGPWEIGQTITVPCLANFAGSVPPYTWTAKGLPTGLTINSATGVITGTVNSFPGITQVTISVVDAQG